MKLTKSKLKEIIREEILAEEKELPKVGDNVDIVTSSFYVQKIKKVSGDYVVVDNKKGKKAPAVILGKNKDKLGLYKPTFKIKINNLKKSKYQHQGSIGITSWILKSAKRAIDGKDLEFDQMGRGKVFGFVNEGKLNEGGLLFTGKAEAIKNANKIGLALKKVTGWSEVSISTLGGEENVAIMIKVSMDEKKDWPRGIFMNSRWFNFHLDNDGNLELYAKDYTLKGHKFRKTRVKNINVAIAKLVGYLNKTPLGGRRA